MLRLFTSKQVSKAATRVEYQPLLPRVWYSIKYFVCLPSFLLAVVFFCLYLRDHQLFFVQKVKVLDPGLHIDKEQLKKIVEPMVNQGFLRFNVQSLQAQLQTLPWVANVAVERSWPDTLIIRVKEYEPVALWGTHNLLAKEGEIFSPGTVTVDMNKLPMLSGPDADAKSVLETYQKMQKMLRPLHLQIKELKVTNRHAWQLKLNNGMVLNLGGKQVLERLHEFVQVYPTVFANSPNKTANIDLRYDHGMAVQWQTKSEAEG